ATQAVPSEEMKHHSIRHCPWAPTTDATQSAPALSPVELHRRRTVRPSRRCPRPPRVDTPARRPPRRPANNLSPPPHAAGLLSPLHRAKAHVPTRYGVARRCFLLGATRKSGSAARRSRERFFATSRECLRVHRRGW